MQTAAKAFCKCVHARTRDFSEALQLNTLLVSKAEMAREQ